MPALAWAEQNKSRLGCERHVEFMLHRLCFLDVLEREGQSAAILYGRKHFAPFMLRHLDDIQQLMGLTLWAGVTVTVLQCRALILPLHTHCVRIILCHQARREAGKSAEKGTAFRVPVGGGGRRSRQAVMCAAGTGL